MTDIAQSTTTDVAIPEHQTVSLDLYADLERQEKFLSETIKEWTTQLKEIREKLQGVMAAAGADEATIAGRPAFTWHYIDNFREAEFKKAYPNLHQQYLEPVVVDKFNVERLKKDNPERYREYQTRQFKRA